MKKDHKPRREGPKGEFEAGLEALKEAAQDSEWAREPLSVVDAARTIVPAPGEASGRLAWAAMTTAGVLRLVIVSLGHLIAFAGSTRIRASVATLVLVLALTLSYLAGHAA